MKFQKFPKTLFFCKKGPALKDGSYEYVGWRGLVDNRIVCGVLDCFVCNYGLTADSLQQSSVFEISRVFKPLYHADVIRFLSFGLKNSPPSCFCNRYSDSNSCIK